MGRDGWGVVAERRDCSRSASSRFQRRGSSGPRRQTRCCCSLSVLLLVGAPGAVRSGLEYCRAVGLGGKKRVGEK